MNYDNIRTTRNFAYHYAKKLHFAYPETWNQNEMAGMDWMQGFMSSHSDISLRKLENTSVARVSAFNDVNVKAFIINYEALLRKHHITPRNIYKIDETGMSSTMETPKVISKCCQKQVGQATSAEQGELVTICAFIYDFGNSISSVFIPHRKKYKDQF